MYILTRLSIYVLLLIFHSSKKPHGVNCNPSDKNYLYSKDLITTFSPFYVFIRTFARVGDYPELQVLNSFSRFKIDIIDIDIDSEWAGWTFRIKTPSTPTNERIVVTSSGIKIAECTIASMEFSLSASHWYPIINSIQAVQTDESNAQNSTVSTHKIKPNLFFFFLYFSKQ